MSIRDFSLLNPHSRVATPEGQNGILGPRWNNAQPILLYRRWGWSFNGRNEEREEWNSWLCLLWGNTIRKGLRVLSALKILRKEWKGAPAWDPGEKEFIEDLGLLSSRAEERTVKGVLKIPGCQAGLLGQEPETQSVRGADTLRNKEAAFAVIHFSRTLLAKGEGMEFRILTLTLTSQIGEHNGNAKRVRMAGEINTDAQSRKAERKRWALGWTLKCKQDLQKQRETSRGKKFLF